MADNVIHVNVTSTKTNRVSITPGQVQNEISATPDTSQYYSNLSKNWAVSESIVDGVDYSSKYYANKAKENAENAQGFESSIKESYNAFLEASANAVQEVHTARDEAIGDLEQTVNNSIAEYTEISNQIKQDNSEASKLAQNWATSEVIVDNLDYSAKYWAGKAKDNSGIFYDELADEDIDVEIISGGYVTKADLELGLDTKQDKGDYALKSEIPNISNLATKDELPTQVSELENDSNYATQTQVLQAIASIPQFKLSIVEALPTTGEKMTLYLVPKEGTNNDVYDEYIWIEQTTSFEHLGTTAVDLTDYVKKTDYATANKAGVIKSYPAGGFNINATNGMPFVGVQSLTQYKGAGTGLFISKGTLENIKNNYVKEAITTSDITLTDDEKTSARTWLGAVGNTDYATADKAGIARVSSYYGTAMSSTGGFLIASAKTLQAYTSLDRASFIAKGTLDNVLTQYSKTVLTTEADYNALTTKDANTLYLIEE